MATVLPCAMFARAQVSVPSDVSVHLVATPNSGLVTGQPFLLTLSVTNHGPNPVTRLLLISTDFQEEFDSSIASNDCIDLGVVVTDGQSYHYNYWWYPTTEGMLDVGSTRECHITLGLSPLAPDTFEFGFAVPEFYEDLDSFNNFDSVILRRASATQLPALSPPALLTLLAGLLVAGASAARSTTGKYLS
ncbi:MAG: hypothetical protein EYC71_06245 [Gammaproteobacteria bacterium]|nr:MAG: hypothetical protein EYC71_06245 [Gammaproteobacteria bacterium]